MLLLLFVGTATKVSENMISSNVVTKQIHTSFPGRRCQRPRNACHPNPCKNRGRCEVASSSSEDEFAFRCSCAQGFSGRLCEGKRQNDTAGDRFRKSGGSSSAGRQRVSFGVSTNVTGSRLFDVKIGLERKRGRKHTSAAPKRRKGLLRFSADGEGRLVASVVEDGGTSEAETAVVIADGRWHRVEVTAEEGSAAMALEVRRQGGDGEGGQDPVEGVLYLPGRWSGVRFYDSLDFGE